MPVISIVIRQGNSSFTIAWHTPVLLRKHSNPDDLGVGFWTTIYVRQICLRVKNLKSHARDSDC